MGRNFSKKRVKVSREGKISNRNERLLGRDDLLNQSKEAPPKGSNFQKR